MTASQCSNPYGIRLPSRWRETTLGDLVAVEGSFIQTGPFGSQLHAHDYKSEGTPVVMPQELGDNRIEVDGIARISEEDRDRLIRHVMEEGDIVFSRRGDVTRRAYITLNESGWLCGTGCLLIRLKNPDVDNQFLSLFFSLPQFKDYITQKAVGATMPNLNTGILERIPIVLPPVTAQQRIASTLSAYDALMENNRRRMGLLEEAARQLYREWFVRLRFPGHEHTRITKGVPEGWERGCLSDFYSTASGGTPSRANPDFFTGDILWVKTQELLNGFVIDTEEKITEDALKKSAANLFPERTVLVAMYGATIGQLGIIASPATSNQACCAIMPRDKRASYIHAFLFFLENKEKLVGFSMGAAQKNINQQIVRSFPMLMPSRYLTELFNEILDPSFNLWLNLQHQNQRLRAARDLLLPRLMSGEIAV